MARSFELLIALAFALFVAAVLGAAALELLLVALERRGRRARPAGRGRRLYRRGVLAAAGAGLLCILWGRFVEPNWPEVTRVRIESAAIPRAARPVRIVHLSDLHCEAEPRLEDRLPALVAAERPDAIVFTGDAINGPGGLPVFRRTMASLARVAPVFAVKGNWDAWYFTSLDRFGGTGATELDGDAAVLDVGGARIRFAGLAFGHETRLREALAGSSREELRVFLYHTPDLAEDLADAGVDLFLCGHTHGGQVRLPFYGALITLSRFGKRFEAGLYRLGGTAIYVNRGIGHEGHGIPPIRFLCRPEITVLEIAPPGGGRDG